MAPDLICSASRPSKAAGWILHRKAGGLQQDNTGLAFRTALGTRFCSSGGNERLNLLLHAPLLRRALDALLGEQTHEDIIFVPSLAWDRGVAASLHRQIAFMIAEFGRRDGLVTNSVGLTSYTDFIVQMILRGITHNYTEQLGQGRHGAGPGYLRRAEAFMRAHAGSPVRLDQIAAAAGCSVRSLSLVFRRFRDTTPLAALHAVRLEAVRAELRDRANPATTAEIARRYGFSNSARFVHAYQQRFGEPPPTRLRRGR
jgi:AraC-like DNA-binding protein